VCHNGNAALEAVRAYRPDVLLLDVESPKLDGFQVAARLREWPPSRRMALVGITGHVGEQQGAQARQVGLDHYLIKPVEPDRLREILARVGGATGPTAADSVGGGRPEGRDARVAEAGERQGGNGRGLPHGPRHGVLMVDDQEHMRRMLDAGLRQEGFAVWLAAEGGEALALYWDHREAIDVVLLDVRMPGLDGPQTLVALRQLNPRDCCCFMSGDLGEYTEEGLRDLGAAAHFHKPFHLADVAGALSQLAGNVRPSSSSP
jgi:CheY-like chemotaxis protein